MREERAFILNPYIREKPKLLAFETAEPLFYKVSSNLKKKGFSTTSFCQDSR
jgi:hypothetical protein